MESGKIFLAPPEGLMDGGVVRVARRNITTTERCNSARIAKRASRASDKLSDAWDGRTCIREKEHDAAAASSNLCSLQELYQGFNVNSTSLLWKSACDRIEHLM